MSTNRKPVNKNYVPYYMLESEDKIKRIPTNKREEDIFQDGYGIGLDEGVKHSNSSPKTINQFKKMNEELTKIHVNVAETKKDVSYLRDMIDELVESVKANQTRCIKCSTDFVKKEEYEQAEADHSAKHDKIDRNTMIIIVLGCLMVGAIFGQESVKTLIFSLF